MCFIGNGVILVLYVVLIVVVFGFWSLLFLFLLILIRYGLFVMVNEIVCCVMLLFCIGMVVIWCICVLGCWFCILLVLMMKKLLLLVVFVLFSGGVFMLMVVLLFFDVMKYVCVLFWFIDRLCEKLFMFRFGRLIVEIIFGWVGMVRLIV